MIPSEQLLHQQLPSDKGSYILVLDLKKRFDAIVGRLGRFEFQPGRYLYVGSAFGPGGIAARCRRHLQKEKKLHWHIDYLTLNAGIEEILFAVDAEKMESLWVEELSARDDLSRPCPGFGSTDSSAESHLFYSSVSERFELHGMTGSYLPRQSR